MEDYNNKSPVMCNQCGGVIEIRYPDKDDPDQRPYICRGCGQGPSDRKDIPLVLDVAMSYAVGIGPRKEWTF